MHRLPLSAILLIVVMAAGTAHGFTDSISDSNREDSIIAAALRKVVMDTIAPSEKYEVLTEADYQAVAHRLGVETACIKAVVEVEAGRTHKGFYKPGYPIINFDLAMFRKYARLKGINPADYIKSHPEVFAQPNKARYGGSLQEAQYARLYSAMTIDTVVALEGTFWGMFQIGGFNWRLCGCTSAEDMVRRMSASERDQLELFATFVQRTGLLKYMKAHNWAGFALRYNGPGYARHGYHTKMAAAYRRLSKKIN